MQAMSRYRRIRSRMKGGYLLWFVIIATGIAASMLLGKVGNAGDELFRHGADVTADEKMAAKSVLFRFESLNSALARLKKPIKSGDWPDVDDRHLRLVGAIVAGPILPANEFDISERVEFYVKAFLSPSKANAAVIMHAYDVKGLSLEERTGLIEKWVATGAMSAAVFAKLKTVKEKGAPPTFEFEGAPIARTASQRVGLRPLSVFASGGVVNELKAVLNQAAPKGLVYQLNDSTPIYFATEIKIPGVKVSHKIIAYDYGGAFKAIAAVAER